MIDTLTSLDSCLLYKRITIRCNAEGVIVDKITFVYNIENERRKIKNLLANGHTYNKIRTDIRDVTNNNIYNVIKELVEFVNES